MIVVGLTGYARTGKDTIADLLVERHGFTKLSFASPLKWMLVTLDPIIHGWDGEVRLSTALSNMGENEVKQLFPEYRRLMQRLGTDCIRSNDPEYWIRQVANHMAELPKPARVVVSDVRFPNEGDFIQCGCTDTRRVGKLDEYYYGQVWRIHRPTARGEGMHPSERSVDKVLHNATILNDGSVTQLIPVVDELVDNLVKRRGGVAA